MKKFHLNILGERINPGFKSTRALFDTEDFAGIQALAVKQVEAGAFALNVNVGPRAKSDPQFMAEVIRAIQAVVSVPLSFDFPGADVQEVCLKAYDQGKASGQLPIINSIAETRWDLLDLLKIRPFKVILMGTERLEDGVAKPNKTGAEIAATAKRATLRMVRDHGMTVSDVYVDISVSALIADTTGMTRATLDGIRLISSDPELKGINISGGLSNIGQQLPVNAADGSNLKEQLEFAFLTLAVPSGMNTVLGTPWRAYKPLDDDNFVLNTFKGFIDLTGSNALRQVRKFYKA
ncbi:MAG TPA: dihydropteroate synthase [Desulfuromonadales bacterium]|nr:dihydropteroate synthase [Desulfuromonadales bacterium]